MVIVFVLYGCAIGFMLLHSIGLAYLSWKYRKYLQSIEAAGEFPELSDNELPTVTIQLPVYNEKYVIARLIDAVTGFDYPRDKFEIQVLDDSTDETSEIIATKLQQIAREGIQISHVRRNSREGYKAGALKYGTGLAKGDLIAIFDADFIPEPDFLKKTVPWFADDRLALVQTRWAHLNANYSVLTRMLAFALDFHFSVEQAGRNSSGYFMNFNGTAGVWRKSAIEDAGGWHADTLTEDLDLSYRAQLRGWKAKFTEEITAPAELPVTINAIKSQQFRWMKGGTENARKNLERVFRSGLSMATKLAAAVHLLGSLVTVSICYILFSSAVLLFYYGSQMPIAYSVLSAPMTVICLLYLFSYWTAFSHRHQVPLPAKLLSFFGTFLGFAALFMSLSPYLSRAALEGVLRIKSPFVRTPKFHIVNKSDNWLEKLDYAGVSFNPTMALEALAGCVLLAATAYAWHLSNYSLIVFFGLPAMGFVALSYYNFRHRTA